MADMEKVVDGLIVLKRFLPSTMWKPINDAIELMKEQSKTIELLEDDLARTNDMLNHYLNGNE